MFHSRFFPQPHASLPEYQSGVLENSPKMVLVSLLTDLSVATGDKILIFRYLLIKMN